MTTRRSGFLGLASATVLVIGILFLGSVPQVGAETLTFKGLNHVTRAEVVPIADVEGHAISLFVREGAIVFQNGEWAWTKTTTVNDTVKGAGTADAYSTYTFLDGSTFIMRRKGTIEATPQGVSSAAKWSGDILSGTGRFQGIKGTVTFSTKLLPVEKGELGPKVLSEGNVVYTLPGK